MAAAELIEKPQLPSDIQKQIQETLVLTEEVLDDGRLMRWRYVARTRTVKEGFLSLADIRRDLARAGRQLDRWQLVHQACDPLGGLSFDPDALVRG